MIRITVERTIDAPAGRVFRAVADVEQFAAALPHVIRTEWLSDQKSGVGARFRETRLMHGKEMTTELEVTEHVENDHVRMVADTHGTVWDTLFSVAPVGHKTKLTVTMDAHAHRLLPKIMNPLFKGLMTKGVAKDIDLVKAACEADPS